MAMRALLALALLLSAGLAAEVLSHDISITLRDDGSGYVEQRYLLRLTDQDKRAFEGFVKEGAGFEQLKLYGLTKAIAYESQDENVAIELTQSDFGSVILQYIVLDMVETVESIGRQELTGVTEKAFTFYDGSTIALPYDPPTVLRISVPSTLKIAREVTPPAYATTSAYDASGDRVTTYEWSYKAPFTSSKFQVLYEKEVALQSQLSLGTIMTEMRDKFGDPLYFVAGIVLLGIIVVYRKEIGALLGESFTGEPKLE